MKQFLIYIGSLLLSVVFFLGVGEYLARQAPNPYKYKEEWMQIHHSEVNTLVFGGSQCFYGIKPELLSGVSFNLANVSQGLEYDLYLLKRYESPNLKTVIIPISYPTLFAEKLEDGSEWYRAIFYKIYMDYPDHSVFSKYNYEFSNYRTFIGKIQKYLLSSTDTGNDEWGWGNTYLLRNKNIKNWDSGEEARIAIQRHTYHDLSRAEVNNLTLIQLIKECKRRNINIVLITTPCWHTYNELLNKQQYYKMVEIINEVVKEYGITYIDYSSDNRFEENDFYDSNHLSDIGADKFSRILNEDLKYYYNE